MHIKQANPGKCNRDDNVVANCAGVGKIVSKNNHSGGLIGRALGSNVSKSYATVDMTTSGLWCQGGFVGSSENTDYTECYADGKINIAATGSDSDHATGGGFIGALDSGMINNSYSASTLVKKGRNFVGRAQGSSAISNSFTLSTSAPTGATQFEPAGCTISNCYILDSVTDTQNGAFAAVSKAVLLTKFKSNAAWTATGEYPRLKFVAAANGTDYKPGTGGAVSSTPDNNNTGASSKPRSDAGTQSAPTASGSGESGQPSASEAASAPRPGLAEVLALIDGLPDDAETLTLKDKAAVKKAKRGFDSLTDAEYAELPPAAIGKLTALHEAMSKLMVGNIVERIEALPEPEKLKAKDKQAVLDVQDDVDFLTELARESINGDLREKLEAAVKAVKAFKDGGAQETGASLTSGEWVWVIVLSAAVAAVIALNIAMSVIIIRKKKRVV